MKVASMSLGNDHVALESVDRRRILDGMTRWQVFRCHSKWPSTCKIIRRELSGAVSILCIAL